jgi:hypothetical protein
MTPYFDIHQPPETPDYQQGAHQQAEQNFWQDTEAQAEGISLAALRRRASKGVKPKPHPSTAILDDDPAKKAELDKAALEAGKTGRHNVILPVGSQIDSGPSADHEAGEIKIQDPATGKTKWRQVRAGLVMNPEDGTRTSSRNVSGG